MCKVFMLRGDKIKIPELSLQPALATRYKFSHQAIQQILLNINISITHIYKIWRLSDSCTKLFRLLKISDRTSMILTIVTFMTDHTYKISYRMFFAYSHRC
jgi:hypothetical protein